MNKRAGAMEFIMTYGWFLLIFAGAISALAYFNVFSFKDSIPDTCTTEAGFLCKDFKATQNTVRLTLRNGNIRDLASIDFSFPDEFTACTSAIAENRAHDNIPETGTKTSTWWFNTTGANIKGGTDMAAFIFTGCAFSGRVIIDYTITYTEAGETVDHTVHGRINVKVTR